ncbi:MAG: TolC family protein [Bacteroidales bacterium]
MKENRFLLFFLCLLFFSAKLSVAQDISLEQAVDQALNNNSQVKQYQEKVKEKKYELNSAWGNFLPRVNVLGGYTHLSDYSKINGGQLTGSVNDIFDGYKMGLAQKIGPYVKQLPPQLQALFGKLGQKINSIHLDIPDLEIRAKDFRTANITALQPLYLGGKVRAGVKFAKAEHSTANIELEELQNELIQQTVDTYLGVALLQKVVTTREEVLKGMKHHESQAKRLIEEGIIPAYHLLRAKVAVANAEQELEDDKNKLDVALLALKIHLGYSEDSVIVVSDSLRYKMNSLNLNELVNNSLVQQPKLRMIGQKEVMVKQNLNVKRSEFLPKVFAFGEYGFFRDDLPIIQPPYAVGIQLNFNIFRGFKDYNEYRAAKAIQRQLDFAKQDAVKKVKLWVNKSFKEVLNAQDKYTKLQHTIDLANENLRMSDRRFKEGMGTSLEVIDARLTLQGVEVKQLQSLYEYYKALSELYVATGNPMKVVDILK